MRLLTTPARPLVALILLMLALASLAACASTPDTTSPTEESHFGSVRIQFRDFRPGGSRLALTNESAMDRVDYYSQTRREAELKVTSDEIMNALVEVFSDEGFWDSARPGQPPSGADKPREGGQELHGILSVETADRTGWITFRKGLTKDELELFQGCSQAFVAIYNATAGYQLVDNPDGDALFKN